MKGKQVRLFLADGTVGGLMTAEIMNWTGHLLKGKRKELGEIRRRPEADRTGIYLLFGSNDGDEKIAYIGQSDNVGKRLMQHDAKKDFWDEVVIITSKDANLTSAHVRYLEARLVEIAQAVGRYDLENGNSPSGGADLPEADASDMNYFIEQVRILLPVLGHDLFRGRVEQVESRSRPGPISVVPEVPEPETPVFGLQSSFGVSANAQVIDGEFTVLKGSKVSARMRRPASERAKSTTRQFLGRSRLHEEMLRSAFATSETLVQLTKDVVFTSPSAAASVVLGRSASNGRLGWKTVEGLSYGEWEDSQA